MDTSLKVDSSSQDLAPPSGNAPAAPQSSPAGSINDGERLDAPKGSHFGITDGKGFHVRFGNGWTISVQFGWGNYCATRNTGSRTDDRANGEKGCENAEVAVFDPAGDFVKLPAFMYDGDEERRNDVAGWCDADSVLRLMNRTASQSKERA